MCVLCLIIIISVNVGNIRATLMVGVEQFEIYGLKIRVSRSALQHKMKGSPNYR